MNRCFKKLLLICIAFVIIINIANVNVFAFSNGENLEIVNNFKVASTPGTEGDTSSPTWINPDDYKPDEVTSAGGLITKGNTLIGIVQLVGSFLSVIVIIILGIRYMYGSTEERAEYKKTMLPYLIGAILIFATTNILAIIEKIAQQI